MSAPTSVNASVRCSLIRSRSPRWKMFAASIKTFRARLPPHPSSAAPAAPSRQRCCAPARRRVGCLAFRRRPSRSSVARGVLPEASVVWLSTLWRHMTSSRLPVHNVTMSVPKAGASSITIVDGRGRAGVALGRGGPCCRCHPRRRLRCRSARILLDRRASFFGDLVTQHVEAAQQRGAGRDFADHRAQLQLDTLDPVGRDLVGDLLEGRSLELGRHHADCGHVGCPRTHSVTSGRGWKVRRTRVIIQSSS